MSINNSNTLASHYGVYYLYYKKIISIEEILKIMNSVTPEDIKRVSNVIFTRDKLKICYMGRKKHTIENIL